jgi:hypothetical protein
MCVASHSEQAERGGHEGHAHPLTPTQAEAEVPLGQHGEQDEAA